MSLYFKKLPLFLSESHVLPKLSNSFLNRLTGQSLGAPDRCEAIFPKIEIASASPRNDRKRIAQFRYHLILMIRIRNSFIPHKKIS
jgi:hypothetical protein